MSRETTGHVPASVLKLKTSIDTIISKLLYPNSIYRVWKGIFGNRDLTKIRFGNRENDKYIDGIRDLIVPQEAGLAKNWGRDEGFMLLFMSVGNFRNRHEPPVLVAKGNQPSER